MVCVPQTNVFLPRIYTDKHGFCICVHPFYLWLILFNPFYSYRRGLCLH